jgi:hypothetical protein
MIFDVKLLNISDKRTFPTLKNVTLKIILKKSHLNLSDKNK